MNFRTMNLDEYLRTRPHSAPVRWLLAVSETARWLYRESLRINAELHGGEPVAERDPVPLQRDPKTGVYRPK